MHQVAPDKFCVRKSDGSARFTGHSSPRGKCHLLFVNRENTAVGYGDFVGIPAEVFNGITKPIESLLDIGAPVLLVKGIAQFRPLVRILQCFAGGGKSKLPLFIKRLKALDDPGCCTKIAFVSRKF